MATTSQYVEEKEINYLEIISTSVFVGIGLITIVVYARILVYHWRNGFKTHFQKILIVFVANDFVAHYTLLFRQRLPTWGVNEWYLYVQTGPIPLLLRISYAFAFKYQVLGTLLVALNRASAIAKPQVYDKFWHAHTWRVCGLLAIYSFLTALFWVTSTNIFKRYGWGNYVNYAFANNVVMELYSLAFIPLCTFIVVLTLFVNLYTGIRLYTYGRTATRSQRLSRQENTFHMTTMAQFLVQMLNAIDSVITATQDMDAYWFFFHFAPVFSDVSNFLPIWFLLVVSPDTRNIVRYGSAGGPTRAKSPVFLHAPSNPEEMNEIEPDDYEGHFVDPFEIVSSGVFITIGFITLFAYIRIGIYHLRHGFKTHYQRIFYVCLTNDLAVHYTQVFRVRLPTWGANDWYWDIRKGPVPVAALVIYIFTLMFQFLGTLLIAINRATSLAFPHTYEKIWLRWTWPSCGFLTLVCLIYALPFSMDDVIFQRFSWGYYAPAVTSSTVLTAVLTDSYYPICMTILGFTFLVNLYTGWRLYNYQRKTSKKLGKQEKIFHLTTICQFIVQVSSTIDIIITITQSLDEWWLFFEFSPVFIDVANFLPIWFLLALSDETRKMVFRHNREDSKETTISIATVKSHAGNRKF